MGKMEKQQAVEFGKAVGDATRQQILRYCCCERRSVGEIADNAGVRQPTASHHLSILESAGLLIREQEGKVVYYHLNQDKLVECCGRLMIELAPEKEATDRIRSCCQ